MADRTISSILCELDRLSDNKLHFRDDVEKLIEIALAKNKINELEKIAFETKFIAGLLGVIKKRDNLIDEEYFLKVQEEYKERLLRVQTILKDFVAADSEFYRSIFDEKFMQMNRQSFENLNFLFSDLSFLKLYFNDRREEDRTR
jgi:hypothetical protein